MGEPFPWPVVGPPGAVGGPSAAGLRADAPEFVHSLWTTLWMMRERVGRHKWRW